jgi:formylglycine-generating enzyme required for sulfatase activity
MMRSLATGAASATMSSIRAAPVWAGEARCPPDSVLVGWTCVDKYEASIWEIPASSASLVNKVERGKESLGDLTKGGATQLGCTFAPWSAPASYPSTFPTNGNWSAPVYAVSVPGVVPSTCLTWFQAEQACAISGKRLLTNQEWQRAAASTPADATICNVSPPSHLSSGPRATGSAPQCTSKWGVFDMVGNVDEWVADWVTASTTCLGGQTGPDLSCFWQQTPGGGLAAVIRGGSWESDPELDTTGAFLVSGFAPGATPNADVGFRCGRPAAPRDLQ